METAMEAPKCIGVIMDGNRRWAKEKGLASFEGHRAGYQKVKEVVEWAKDAGVKYVILYALSTENWNRSKEEVSYLMDLFRLIITEEVEKLKENRVRTVFAGDLTRFPKDLQEMMENTQQETEEGSECILVIAASYGGRAEIVNAVNVLLKEKKETVTEEEFAAHLWTAPTPDPDLIIRTGGEKRLSGFLPWQSVYSELFFTKTFWPDFSKEEFTSILETFSTRQRRMGK